MEDAFFDILTYIHCSYGTPALTIMSASLLILATLLVVTLHQHQHFVSAAVKWQYSALGRPIHVFNYSDSSDILLLTSLSTVACLDAQTSEIQWRIPPPLSEAQLQPLSAFILQPPSPSFLLVLLSDNKLRAIDIVTQAIVWIVPACKLGHPQHDLIPITTCDGQVKYLQPSTGAPFSPFNTTISSPSSPTTTDVSLQTNTSFEPLSLPADVPHLQWPFGRRWLTSASDGTFCLQDDSHGRRQLWCREDGIAHVSSGAIYTTETTTMLVILSQLGSLYGLWDATVLWKVSVGHRCTLLNDLADTAVVICTYDEPSSTLVRAIRVSDGTVVFSRAVSHFRAVHASVDRCCGSAICVVAVDESGFEQWISGCDVSALRSNPTLARGWLFYSHGGKDLRAVRGGTTAWIASVPSGSTISTVVTSRHPHPAASKIRSPAVRVTGSRKVLRKFVDENVILILAEDTVGSQVHALLLDGATGALYNAVTHPKAHSPMAGVRGDNWFVYSLWNEAMMHQELHVIDMYHRPGNGSWVGATIRLALRTLLGPEIMYAFGIPDPDSPPCRPSDSAIRLDQCVKEPPVEEHSTVGLKPIIYRSGVVSTRRIMRLDVIETIMSIIESSIIITHEGGQVSLVSKFLLDARRPDAPSPHDLAELLTPYTPVLPLESSGKLSPYVANGLYIPLLKHVAVAPRLGRESSTQIALLGMDAVFSVEQPAGSFDTLPEDFFYSAVVAMIIALVGGVIYSQKLKVRTSLSKSW